MSTTPSVGFSFSQALSAQAAKSLTPVSEAPPKVEPVAQTSPEALLAADSWQRGEVQLRCVEKWNETHNVVSFRFQGLTPVKFNFKPGQFITFKLDINGEKVYRSYTISSSPSRPFSLVVTVKRITNGVVSNYLADTLNVGDEVTVTGPDGVFNLVDIVADKYLFLSAGCGVTPMHSMSRWLCDTTTDSDIAFVHSAKTVNDVMFADSMASMASRSQKFNLNYMLKSDDNSQMLSDKHAETGFGIGRLNLESLIKLVPDYQQRTVFVCGPESYMADVKLLLQAADFDMSQFNQESFGDSSALGLKAALESNPSTEQFMLSIGDKDIQLTGDQTLLDGIESEKLPIIAACRSGVCGACKCQVVSGTTQSTSTMNLTADEIAAGFVLACSTKLTSDVQLKM
ncbi:hybrid-cluster NAD(P)-dependent oxidoreductase [Shewanella saliphila]|uniref:Hybrid-cluster NAD(P)-dependent oxidoreductase n=1 Tax=Shewanella saliphila TaxID=2282698 RepID=A0ABQ2Q5G9_9GAMM|nr:hybrid-cluster NAD(P)-dependent oxidoreductase [Shewanella saliphila]MCL1103028.1 hybrid-cluster NAD(P)-dependent oxidoreductase [Shewanella saliphila]GGP47349.1 hybrid-cluster NAD(P)-dependent oxidoreductase [Shewanella saliphila]